MNSRFTRRDFLKLAGLLPLGGYASALARQLEAQPVDGKKNVIICVFDAWSARHISLLGYERDTTPNINRLAGRATVYHNHFASSNFTSPGTASLFTGVLPWTHRAFQPNSWVAEEYAERNIFSLFKDYYKLTYSHNTWVNTLFDQFKNHIDEWIPRDQLMLFSSDKIVQKVFSNDRDISAVAWVRNVKIKEGEYVYSLFLSKLVTALENKFSAKYESQFPRGLPSVRTDGGFLLEHAVDWLADRIIANPKPLLGYFHFFPPHDPYRTHSEFIGRFLNDDYQPVEKPEDIFAIDQALDAKLLRRIYDEFILYVDREFGRLFEILESSGQLENTILVLTSDHGEMFERGVAGHITDSLYQPLVRVPLLIFDPSNKERQDVHVPTSAVDLLPTLAHLSGLAVPEWTEGVILPPYQDEQPLAERSIFSVRSYDAPADEPLSEASVVIIKGRYKLHYYFGYSILQGQELIKLFDIEADPEELNDLVNVEVEIAAALLKEIKDRLAETNGRY
jgi:arylsulfatase A-like enzyme